MSESAGSNARRQAEAMRYMASMHPSFFWAQTMKDASAELDRLATIADAAQTQYEAFGAYPGLVEALQNRMGDRP